MTYILLRQIVGYTRNLGWKRRLRLFFLIALNVFLVLYHSFEIQKLAKEMSTSAKTESVVNKKNERRSKMKSLINFRIKNKKNEKRTYDSLSY